MDWVQHVGWNQNVGWFWSSLQWEHELSIPCMFYLFTFKWEFHFTFNDMKRSVMFRSFLKISYNIKFSLFKWGIWGKKEWRIKRKAMDLCMRSCHCAEAGLLFHLWINTMLKFSDLKPSDITKRRDGRPSVKAKYQPIWEHSSCS